MSIAEAEVTSPEPLFMVEDVDPRDASHKRAGRILPIKGVVVGFLVGLSFAAAYSFAIGFPIKDGMIVYAFIAGPICLAAMASSLSYGIQNYERRLLFRDGFFIWKTPTRFEKHPASDCTWYYGKACHDKTLDSQLLSGRSLVLVFPGGRSVACGLTADKREEWKQLFEQVGCIEILKGSVWRQLFKIAAIAYMFLVGCYTGWQLGTLIVNQGFANQWIPALNNKQFEELLPVWFAALYGWCFALGICLLVPSWWPATKFEKNQLMSFAIRYSFIAGVVLALGADVDLKAGLIAGALLALIILPTTYVICRIEKAGFGENSS